jgi:hypothetical protein
MTRYVSHYVSSAQSAREDAHNYRLKRKRSLLANTLQTLPKQKKKLITSLHANSVTYDIEVLH